VNGACIMHLSVKPDQIYDNIGVLDLFVTVNFFYIVVNCISGKCHLGNCTFGHMSFWANVFLANVFLGNCL
jgi:hypothetical protein